MVQLLCRDCGGFYEHSTPHDCRMKRKAVPVAPKAIVDNGIDNAKRVVDNKVDNELSPTVLSTPKSPLSTAERVKKWRQGHREEYNAQMREYRKRGAV